MDFSVKSGSPEKQRTPCLVVAIFESKRLSHAAKAIDDAGDGYLTNLVKRGDINARLGHTTMLLKVSGTAAERVLVVGCGSEREFDERKYRIVIEKAAEALHSSGASEALSYLGEVEVNDRDTYWKTRQNVEITEGCAYRFDQHKSNKREAKRSLKRLTVAVAGRGAAAKGGLAVRHAKAIAAGVKLAKDLGNSPANYCTPTDLAKQAQDLGKRYSAIKTTVLDEARMKRLGMGSLLSVSQGSRQPAKLITIEYTGAKKAGAKPVVLVGKGVTFDSGGISIKPSPAMDEMKYDMCGAASVLGTMQTVAQLRLPINVVGIVPATENLPDGLATKPGDVVTSMSGQTIEVLNTDAEGRLILCDALTYAERFKPSTVVDIATLTGACLIALGKHATGLFSNDDPLASDLVSAGEFSGDRAWRMPLWDDYQHLIDSPFADMANVGGREGGSITAACFLSRFTKKYRWAHLDIAGTAWRGGAAKGATGRPVTLLVQYLITQCT